MSCKQLVPRTRIETQYDPTAWPRRLGSQNQLHRLEPRSVRTKHIAETASVEILVDRQSGAAIDIAGVGGEDTNRQAAMADAQVVQMVAQNLNVALPRELAEEMLNDTQLTPQFLSVGFGKVTGKSAL